MDSRPVPIGTKGGDLLVAGRFLCRVTNISFQSGTTRFEELCGRRDGVVAFSGPTSSLGDLTARREEEFAILESASTWIRIKPVECLIGGDGVTTVVAIIRP